MSVIRYHRKPEPDSEGELIAAKYTDGGPLDELVYVASQARNGEAAECELPSQRVLLARWLDDLDGSVQWRYAVVEDEKWLCYSVGYGSLVEDSDAGLAQWYEPA